MPRESRIESARRRAHVAKRAVALAATGAFVIVLGLARHAHPGTAASSGSGSSGSSSTGSSSPAQQGFSLGGGSIGPSSGGSSSAPVQTGTS